MLQTLMKTSLAELAKALQNCQNHFNTWEFRGVKVSLVLVFNDRENKLGNAYEEIEGGRVSINKGFSLEHNPPSSMEAWEGTTEITPYWKTR